MGCAQKDDHGLEEGKAAEVRLPIRELLPMGGACRAKERVGAPGLGETAPWSAAGRSSSATGARGIGGGRREDSAPWLGAAASAVVAAVERRATMGFQRAWQRQ